MTTQTNARRTRRNRLVPTALPRACRRSRLSSWGICSSSEEFRQCRAQAQCPGGDRRSRCGHWASIRWMRRSASDLLRHAGLAAQPARWSYAGAEFKEARDSVVKLRPVLRTPQPCLAQGARLRVEVDATPAIRSGRMKVEVQTPSSLMCLAVADRSAGSSTRSNGPCSIRTRRAIYSSTTSPSWAPLTS